MSNANEALAAAIEDAMRIGAGDGPRQSESVRGDLPLSNCQVRCLEAVLPEPRFGWLCLRGFWVGASVAAAVGV